MAQQGTRTVNTDIAIFRERSPSKEQENKRGYRGTLIHALEKRLRERERENYSGGARPLIY